MQVHKVEVTFQAHQTISCQAHQTITQDLSVRIVVLECWSSFFTMQSKVNRVWKRKIRRIKNIQ